MSLSSGSQAVIVVKVEEFVQKVWPFIEGKTVIVMGANIGLGFEVVKHYVRLHAEKVIVGCRSVEKGEKA